jgi:hypothetical protein
MEVPSPGAIGDVLRVPWHIEGWDYLAETSDLRLVVEFEPGYLPIGPYVPDLYEYPANDLVLAVSGPSGDLQWEVTPEAERPFHLIAGLFQQDLLISTASFTVPDPRFPVEWRGGNHEMVWTILWRHPPIDSGGD